MTYNDIVSTVSCLACAFCAWYARAAVTSATVAGSPPWGTPLERAIFRAEILKRLTPLGRLRAWLKNIGRK